VIFLLLLFLAGGQSRGQTPFDCPHAFVALSELGSRPLPLERLKNLRAPDEEIIGMNHRKIYFAELDGEKVFVKVSFASDDTGRSFENLVKEMRWTKRIQELGLGPRYRGLVKTPEGFGLVTDFFPGKHVDELEQFAKLGNWINENTVKDLERIREIYAREGIIPGDFQFRLGPDGHVAVIDVAFYLQKGDDLIPKVFTKSGLAVIDKYLNHARSHLAP
jgi:hypothetical protein